jgi:hypothetical protein
MALTETILFYVLIGAGVAAAVLLSGERRSPSETAFRFATAVPFWPLYLPGLLARPAAPTSRAADDAPDGRLEDELAVAIRRVEHELDDALRSLEGWGESVLACEHGRFAQLRAAWRLQAERIRELDRLLSGPGFSESGDQGGQRAAGMDEGEAVLSDHDAGRAGDGQECPSHVGRGAEAHTRERQCEAARRQNIRRLRAIRNQLHRDLLGTLAWVRELVTMIHLARHTGAPVSRTEELVAQIAAAVEGLSEVSQWEDEPPDVSVSVSSVQEAAEAMAVR